MNEEKLNQQYRDEGWGRLAEAAGFSPFHTEAAARDAFRFSFDIIQELTEALQQCRDKLESTARSECEGVWDESEFEKMLAPYDAALAKARFEK